MKTTVLFVCVENSCRSQIAEAFAKMLGATKIEAYSSGSAPSGVVNPKAIASLAEIGYDMDSHNSKPLSALPDIRFDYAITMGCGDACPTVAADNRADWKIPDPKHLPQQEFNKIRDLIRAKVQELIDSL